MQPRAYTAIGDSFSAGAGCPPGTAFTDLIAERLARGQDRFRYRNFAVDGAKSSAVLAQVDDAIALEPDVVTITCGGNDVLFSTRPNVDAFTATLDEIFGRLRAARPDALMATMTAPETWLFYNRSPRTRARLGRGLAQLNPVIRRLAKQYGVACLEVAEHTDLSGPQTFAEDGLHPSPRTHLRIADELEPMLAASASEHTMGAA
jgi:lysophospholipase L1-like esterase